VWGYVKSCRKPGSGGGVLQGQFWVGTVWV